MKKGEESQTAISSSASLEVTINKTSFLSAKKSLAFVSTCLALRSNLLLIFFTFSASPERTIFTLTFLLNFSRAGTKTRDLSSKSRADVQIKTSFLLFQLTL